MKHKKLKSKTFQGMGYREVQRHNSINRAKLSTIEKQWLKNNGYRNVGWNKVINLFNKIKEFSNTLEDLFLEADRIGNKYQTSQEINSFYQKLAKELNEIAEEIDKQFPDSEIEVIDYSNKKTKKYSRIKIK